jgi:hypothetical protein
MVNWWTAWAERKCSQINSCCGYSNTVLQVENIIGIVRMPAPASLAIFCIIIFAYARRWQVEMSLRFTKSEMAFESPRLLKWEARLKFLLTASLAYAFLLSLLPNIDFLFAFLSRYCHRTGKWSRDATQSAPLYRLRLALSRLWLQVRPLSLPTLISG